MALHHESAPEYEPQVLKIYVLLGDPAIRLKSAPVADFAAPRDPDPRDPDPVPSTTNDSPLSVAGCAVQVGEGQTSLGYLLLAFFWICRRLR